MYEMQIVFTTKKFSLKERVNMSLLDRKSARSIVGSVPLGGKPCLHGELQ